MINILMPVFNAAPFLEECLQSILAQTEKDWELLAVNDFSEDESLTILNAFAEKDARIKIFQNNKKGIIPALRLAFTKSKGQYITRMDADDLMPPQKLELLKSNLEKEGIGHLVTGKVEYFSNNQLGEGYQKYAQWLNDLTGTATNFSEIYKECVIPSPAWMLHREDLMACGAFESDTYPEDYDLCFRFYKQKLKVKACSEIVHLWRDHTQRSSRTDPNYANQQYFELKLPYFLELDYDPNKPLILWGAGKKGKALARMLNQRAVDFRWVCNSASKWGKKIYETEMENFEILEDIYNPQLIIAVAGPDDQAEIKAFLDRYNWKKITHYHFFC